MGIAHAHTGEAELLSRNLDRLIDQLWNSEYTREIGWGKRCGSHGYRRTAGLVIAVEVQIHGHHPTFGFNGELTATGPTGGEQKTCENT